MFEIGNSLRETRVRQGLEYPQIELATKIRAKYLRALEDEQFAILPAQPYVKGFLRTYSTYLGLDPEVIIGEFRSRGMAPSAEHHEPFSGSSVIGKPRSHRGRNTVVVVAVVCLIALAVIYTIGLLGNDNNSGGEPQTHPGALGIGSPSPSASKSPKPTSSSSAIPAWEKNLVKIKATKGDCWMEIRRNDSTGVSLFSGTLKKGDQKKFKGKDIWMSFGAPANVQLEAAGKKTKLKSDVGPWTVEVIQGRVVQGPNVQG